ncbi:hypothetical protein CKO42_07195 [Lamprobacter modestohalophilus]|uniref:Uncharacterized protein n=1 Tax=Lamprobacter modestohalophilus TaxID=1064514 RepID=A0A9X0W7G5_9GAMM|nr:hypothetical protein [Lamprobacter modestohalophilus]
MEDLDLFTAVNPVRKAIALAALLAVSNQAAHAVGFGDMFNPGRWFGGDSNDYYYDEGPWGPHAPGPYGAPGYAPYGGHGYGYSPYGAPAYGTQGPAYGAPAYTAPALPPASESAPETSNSAKDREIEALKRRIEQLESRNAPPSRSQPPQGQSAGEGWPSAPAFRPMDQY